MFCFFHSKSFIIVNTKPTHPPALLSVATRSTYISISGKNKRQIMIVENQLIIALDCGEHYKELRCERNWLAAESECVNAAVSEYVNATLAGSGLLRGHSRVCFPDITSNIWKGMIGCLVTPTRHQQTLEDDYEMALEIGTRHHRCKFTKGVEICSSQGSNHQPFSSPAASSAATACLSF